MSYLEVGTKAPDFILQKQNGENRSLGDYAGKKLVLYFYPKDNTPGCTLEANDFKTLHSDFESLGTSIVGVSADSVKSHDGFACKYELPFDLLSDPEHSLMDALGVWQLKKNYGKEYMGIARTTYLLDEKGCVLQVWKVGKAAGHAQKVLDYLNSLS